MNVPTRNRFYHLLRQGLIDNISLSLFGKTLTRKLLVKELRTLTDREINDCFDKLYKDKSLAEVKSKDRGAVRTYQEVADIMGVSKQTIHNLERTAFAKLKAKGKNAFLGDKL